MRPPLDLYSRAFRARRAIAQLLLLSGLLACLAGWSRNRLWEVFPLNHGIESVGLGAASLALAFALARLARWSLASALVLVWLLPLVVFGGLLATLAVILLALAALGLGNRLLASAQPSQCALAVLLGLALIAGFAGWLLPLPIFMRPLWLLMLLPLIGLRRKAIGHGLEEIARGWQQAVAQAPRMATVAILLLGLASLSLWPPTMQFDDLGYHLGLAWQLQLHAQYRLDPSTQVWALAPWSSDVLHGLVQLLAGGEGRGPLNALWLALTASFCWQLAAELRLAPTLRWLAVSLYASLPMTAVLGGGMQTENAAAAGLLALALLIQRAHPPANASALLAITGAAAFLLALKANSALYLLPMLLWLVWRWRGALPWRAVPAAIGLAVLIGGSSYTYATAIAGNPVFPLFNHVFHSPYFADTNFTDMRWHAGFNLALPWHLTFHSSRYGEVWDGGGGFLLIALGGALLAGLLRRRTRTYALAAIAAFAMALLPLQYLRYAHPGMVLLIPVMMVGLELAANTPIAVGVVLALAAANLGYQGNAHWMLRGGVVTSTILAHGNSDPVFHDYAPERLLMRYARERMPANAHVLATDSEPPFVAELGGGGLTTAWYDPALAAASATAETDTSGETWRALLVRNRITAVMTKDGATSAPLRAGMLLTGAKRVNQHNGVELWKIDSQIDAAEAPKIPLNPP